MKSIIFTVNSFVYSYINSSLGFDFIKVHPKKAGLIKGGRFNVVIYDVGSYGSISISSIHTLRKKANKMICITPSDDLLILRTFPFYLFDYVINFPFRKYDLLCAVKKKQSSLAYTKKIVELYEDNKISDLLKCCEPISYNEIDLMCVYHSLMMSDRFNEANERLILFYENKKNIHPKIKLIRDFFKENNYDAILGAVKKEPLSFCSKPFDQVCLQAIGIRIINDFESVLVEVSKKQIIFPHEIEDYIELSKREKIIPRHEVLLIMQVLFFRQFDIYKSLTGSSKFIVFFIAYKINDFFLISQCNLDGINISPLIRTILEGKIKKKNSIRQIKNNPFNAESVVDYLGCIKKRDKDKDAILSSIYCLALKDKGGKLFPEVERINKLYIGDEIISVYKKGVRLAKLSENKK